MGRAPIGPVNQATPVLDYADYTSTFGGVNKDSAISYQASAFFGNGGEQAVVVRLYANPTTTTVTIGGAPATTDTYTINYTINRGAPVSVHSPGQASASALAQALAGLLQASLTAATATVTTAEAQITIRMVASGQALTFSSQVTTSAPPPTVPGGTMTVGAPATISTTGLAAIPISASGLTTVAAPALPHSSVLFTLQAANPGIWGNQLTVSIGNVPASFSSLYQQHKLNPRDPTQTLFNLSVSYFDGATHHTESFVNVTLHGDDSQANRLDKVLANGSRYVRCAIPTPNAPPPLPNPATAATLGVGFGFGGADSAVLQDTHYTGNAGELTGLHALSQLPCGWNILCVPSDDIGDPNGGDQHADVYQEAAQICVDNNAMLIIDPPTSWYGAWQSGQVSAIRIDDPQLGTYTAARARCAAIYFPRVVIADPLLAGTPKTLPPCGFMAAVWASTDKASGIWKAPAGLDAPIGGIIGLQANLGDDDSGQLNPRGINALRSFKPGGDVVWGARTLRGSDVLADEYKYIPVQRLALYLQTTLSQDTRWAVFEPNGPALWARLQTQLSTLMGSLFSRGAFAGTSASQAFFIQCDATTTTPADQAAGIVNLQVGFAPLYPAEFVVITVSQMTAPSG